MLADYEYNLIELTEEQLPAFLERRDFAAVNVTMPYKQAVIPCLDVVSDIARRIGAVNTVVHRNGKLYGYNTDYHGMVALIRRLGLDLRGKKVLILGTGGTPCRALPVPAHTSSATWTRRTTRLWSATTLPPTGRTLTSTSEALSMQPVTLFIPVSGTSSSSTSA